VVITLVLMLAFFLRTTVAAAEQNPGSSPVAGDEQRAAAAAHRADKLFDAGAKDFEHGRYAEALANLESAHATYPTFRTAAVLGQVELHLKSYRDAAEHLDFALRSLPSTSEHETRQRVMRGLTEARRNVHALSIHCDTRGAEVLIDGAHIAVTPLGHELFVEPGNHEVVLRKAGHRDFSMVAYFPAGGARRVQAALERLSTSSSGPRQARGGAKTGDAAPSGPSQNWTPTVWALGGTLALGAASFGVTYQLSSWNATKQLDKLSATSSLAERECNEPDAPLVCDELATYGDRSIAHQQYAWVGYRVAGAAALATLGLVWWLDDPAEESRLAVTAAPAPGADGGLLRIGGRF